MKNISEFLYLSFATALFCIGISFFLLNYRSYKKTLKEVILESKDHQIVSQVARTHFEEVSYSKGYIMALLLEPLDYDIQVDQYLIKKESHHKGKIKNYIFSSKWYEKKYLYDELGNIYRIQFIGQ